MQFTKVFAHNVVMVQYDAAGFVGHVVLGGSHALVFAMIGIGHESHSFMVKLSF